MRSIVITVEGVLRKLTDGSPIREGIELVSNFTFDLENLIFLTDKPAAETEDWLDLQNIPHDLILGKRDDRVHQLRKIQHEWGYAVDMVIEPDPTIVNLLVEQGFMVLGFFHPYFAKPEWRPDYMHAVRPWNDLAQSIADTARQRAAADVKLRDGLL